MSLNRSLENFAFILLENSTYMAIIKSEVIYFHQQLIAIHNTLLAKISNDRLGIKGVKLGVILRCETKSVVNAPAHQYYKKINNSDLHSCCASHCCCLRIIRCKQKIVPELTSKNHLQYSHSAFESAHQAKHPAKGTLTVSLLIKYSATYLPIIQSKYLLRLFHTTLSTLFL